MKKIIYLVLISFLGISSYATSRENFYPNAPRPSTPSVNDSKNFAQDPMVTDNPEYSPSIKSLKFSPTTLNIKEVFASSPIIYSALFILSIASFVIWLYSLFTFRVKDVMPSTMINDLRYHLSSHNYKEALNYCEYKNNIFSKIITAGINARKYSPQFIIDAMKSEGKRATSDLWQRIALLNDIVIIAPMLGLLGTVLGMFYAFYDINRSAESLSALFDGLGIAVGTTVAGLIVAIIAMIFHATLKYRLMRMLTHLENESVALSSLIKPKQIEDNI
ncbi:MAG: MotA/TolQ/ExbB proton channel family protein [Parachlamydiales bacterium]|nr:MotA/TolQ/ExbB proton channel family protein [Parachlamydiales bacterium]